MFFTKRNLKFRGCIGRSFVASVTSALLLSAAAAQAPILTVTNGNDSGVGTLRQAILDASSSGGDTINLVAGGFTDYLLFNPSTRRTAIWNLQGNALLGGVYGPTLPAGWVVACMADVNLDGKPDYVLFNASTRRTAVWFLNNATFLSGVYGPTLPPGWTLITAADMNNDGRPDYVLFNPGTRQTAIWFLNGTTFTGGAFGPTLPSGWMLIDALDFNANNKPDYLLFNPTTRQSAIWYLNGTTFAGGVFGPTLPSGWTLQGAADFNTDAKPDYVLFQASTGRTAIWYLNNNAFVTGAYGPTLPAGWNLIGHDLGLRITSISTSALTPFATISIGGTGFEPMAAISVRFFNDSGFSVELPVVSATSTSVQVIAPPYFNPVTQDFASGAVSLEVLQTIGTATAKSNTVSGLTIAEMPALTMPPGTVTANWAGFLELYLSGVEADLADAQTFSGGQVNTVDLQASIQTIRTNFGQLKDLIRVSISDPSQAPTIGILSGVPITLNQTMLRQSDQLVIAMFQQLSAELQATTAATSTTFLDRFATANQTATSTTCALNYSQLFQVLIGTPNSETVANAMYATDLQQCADYYRDVLAPALEKEGTVFAVLALIPSPAQPASAGLAAALPWAAVATQGMAARLDFVAAALKAEDPVALQRAIAAWSGTLKGARCGEISEVLHLITSAAGEIGNLLFDTGVKASGICDTQMPTYEGQVHTYITSHEVFMLTIVSAGTGSGTVTMDPLGPTYINGTVVTLTATPATGSTFVGWSGDANSSSLSIDITMNSNKSVTATFSSPNPPPLTGTWIGTWTWTATASNGCTINDGGSFSMTLTQTGSSFSGSTSGAGVNGYDDTCNAFPVTGTGTASGTISGTTLSLSFDLCLGGCIGFTGTATLNNNTLTASFVGDSSGGNTPGSGSFTVTRQ